MNAKKNIMKIKIMLLLLMVFFFENIIAQDTIMKVNGVKIVVKVTEVNTSSVKYTAGNNTMDHLYEINKNDIHLITYQNGVKEFFAPLEILPPDLKKITPTEIKRIDKIYGKNIVALNFFEMAFTNLSFSYERIFESGDFSIKIPLSFSLGGKPAFHDYGTGVETIDFLQNKIYGTGLEFNYYPLGQTRHTFYLGLSAAYGTFNYYTYSLNPNYNYNYYNNYNNAANFDKHLGIHYSGLIHVGGYLGLTDKILMGGKVGIGFKREETIFVDYTHPRVQLDFNLAYRF